MLRIGTAGWSIPPAAAASAPGPGTHLERYARVLPCAEINSSFHRAHRLSTWERWAAATPPEFRFSVKLPKAITHVAKLVVEPRAFDAFADETAALGQKLGVVLVQLPPSLDFTDCPAVEFLEAVRECFPVTSIALEPRHRSWFTDDTDELLEQHRIAQVAADPLRDPRLAKGELPVPGGWDGLRYYRLHGSPRMYYSAYPEAYLRALSQEIAGAPQEKDVWVIFDNTASGEAFGDALRLQQLSRELAGLPGLTGSG